MEISSGIEREVIILRVVDEKEGVEGSSNAVRELRVVAEKLGVETSEGSS